MRQQAQAHAYQQLLAVDVHGPLADTRRLAGGRRRDQHVDIAKAAADLLLVVPPEALRLKIRCGRKEHAGNQTSPNRRVVVVGSRPQGAGVALPGFG